MIKCPKWNMAGNRAMVPGFGAVLIDLLTVGFPNIKETVADPLNSLKSEYLKKGSSKDWRAELEDRSAYLFT
jgi:hypothetical protein